MEEIFVPALGMAMDNAVLLEWLKQPGDAVNAGDVVAANIAAVMTRYFMEGVPNNRFHFRHVELVCAGVQPMMASIAFVTSSIGAMPSTRLTRPRASYRGKIGSVFARYSAMRVRTVSSLSSGRRLNSCDPHLSHVSSLTGFLKTS